MGHEGHEHPEHGEGHGDDHRHEPEGAHEHAHEHSHGHDHSHGHADEHGHSKTLVELDRDAGKGKVLFLDAPSGLAGDMIVAALVDLGVPARAVADALAALPVTGFHVHFGTRVRSGVVASSFEVHVDGAQPPRTYASIRAMLDESRLPGGVKARAHRTFRRLAVAEAKVHASALDDVHFHEVGAVDAIADVVGSAAALDWLDAELVVSPLPMGRGFVRAAHGTLPLPPPATVECLAGLATYDGGLDFEFVTPTGAAIVGAHAGSWSRWPAMSPEKVGWGAGTADLADRPNVLRAVLGAPTAAPRAHWDEATHVVLEANVDDATGELAASWIASLLEAGAADAWATPMTMKKGRPALTLSALAATDRADAIEHAMLRETTSLGVRRYPVARAERPRRMVSVETPYGTIPVKLAEGPFGPPQAKPEFDACAAAARAHGVPVREVLRAAAVATAALLRGR
jgi:pyridinium-3,5-bisthiocarboxylic acid mononucleotide nickel chelatase